MKKVFEEYGKIYEEIFEHLYPAKNNTGFAERNLSVNFSKAYEKVATSKAISWFEFQFGAKNNLHLDALILDASNKKLMLIESKRFSSPSKKIREIYEDIDRIYSCIEELRTSNNNRIFKLKKYKTIYGIVLADVWSETKKKKSILAAYKEKNFLQNFSTNINTNKKITNETYYVYNFRTVPNYHLVSFVWKL